MSIKTILISQPKPANENSPYSSLTRKHKVKIDFRKFIHVEGLTAKEVRAQRVDFSKFHNVILTSRNSVDHFFRINCSNANSTSPPAPFTISLRAATTALACCLRSIA